jgi:signal transduction histidine kinase
LARRFRIALDCSIAASVAATFVWYYLLAPRLSEFGASSLQLMLSLAYPIGLLVLLYSLLALMKSEVEAPMGRPALMLGIGICCILGAVTAFAYESLKGRYIAGGVLDAAWPIGYTLIALAGRNMLRADASQAGEVRLSEDYRREWNLWSGLLPYGLMPIVLALGWHTRSIGTAQGVEIGVEIGVVIVVVLVSIRQFLDYLDGRRLYYMLYESHEALREMGQDLERRVDRRTRQLQSANRDLESLTYSIAHDLRSPLRGINGFAGALIEEYGPKLDEQGLFYLRRIATASDHLGEVMDAISELAHVSQHEVHYDSVDLSLMVREAADRLSRANPGRLVDWRIQDGIVAGGDKRLLRGAIENLVSNAWRFTEDRASAEIIFACEENNGRVTYRICDNGIGFDPGAATRLFQPFRRLHSSAEPGRIGIGLALAQRIVQKHGGEMWAEGEPGAGACFYFTLDRPAAEVDGDGHLGDTPDQAPGD